MIRPTRRGLLASSALPLLAAKFNRPLGVPVSYTHLTLPTIYSV